MNDYDENKEYKSVKSESGCLPVAVTGFIILVVLIVMSAIMTGCKTIYDPVRETHTEYTDKYLRDSIHILDSVYIREKGDTVFLSHWKIEYRDRVRVDSIHVTDSVPKPYPIEVIKKVEKELSWWQNIKMEAGGIALGILIVGLIYVVIRLVGSVKSVGWKAALKLIFKIK